MLLVTCDPQQVVDLICLSQPEYSVDFVVSEASHSKLEPAAGARVSLEDVENEFSSGS